MTDTTDLIQRLRRHRGDYVEEMDEAADALEQQAAQIEALRADAERYRWLCRNNFDREKFMQVHTWIQTWEPHSQTGESTRWVQRVRGGAYLSEVIDAALRQEQPKPLVEIGRRTTPCGECHLQPGECCDICGARDVSGQPAGDGEK